MIDYTAPDGTRIEQLRDPSRLVVRRLSGDLVILPMEAHALAHAFEADRDEKLGRWRWPENPDYVVYHNTVTGRPTDGTIVVIHEPSGDRGWADPDGGYSHQGATAPHLRAASLAYFAAHPPAVRKPWDDARFGEVWALTDSAGFVMPATFQAPGVWHSHGSMSSRVRDDMNITAGRRLWPEAD